MAATPYIIFLTVEGNEDLLRASCRKFYPKLKHHYTCRGLVSFKSKERLDAQKLLNIHPSFYLRKGLLVERFSSLEKLQDYRMRHHADLELTPWQVIAGESPSIKRSGTWYLTWVKVTKNERRPYWLMISQTRQSDTLNPRENPLISVDRQEYIPSRAYYKLAEAFQRLKLDFPPGTHVLDIGSAPGGTSLLLSKKDYNVTAVDPGPLSPEVADLKNVTFYQCPIRSFNLKDLGHSSSGREKMSMLSADMNLPPRQSLQQACKLARSLPNLKTMLITLKTPSSRLVNSLGHYQSTLLKEGFKNVFTLQLYHHRREILLVAQN